MTTCLLQQALQTGTETLATLEERYALKVKRHGKYPQLVQLKYNQISSPMENPLVQEARGIILDEGDNWRVVARPFDKFFNMGESNAADLDWKTARVLEKLDGSLAIVYEYNGEWLMATSGTPDGSGPVGNSTQTFADLFWKTFYDMGYLKISMDPKYTYMFELMTPDNRVVVPHTTGKTLLIGVRDRNDGSEREARDFGDRFKVVPEFNYNSTSPEILVNSFDFIDGLQQEGYVVVDAQFRRLKIKHPKYVLLHQMVGSMTKKRVLDAIRRGESPEILVYFSQWKQDFEAMREKFEALVKEAETAYNLIKDIASQKEFALCATKTRFSSALFSVRSGKSKDIRSHFAEMRLETLAEMLNLKEEPNDVPGTAE